MALLNRRAILIVMMFNIKRITLETQRLILRQFSHKDAGKLRELADDPAIADTTLILPQPYTIADARSFIAMTLAGWDMGDRADFAIVTKEDNQLIGTIGLRIERTHDKAELGYWIGKAYWNRGYATEAAIKVIDYGFRDLKLNRIEAYHFTRNPASGRVLQKAGMTYEGTLRHWVKSSLGYEDCAVYSILRSD